MACITNQNKGKEIRWKEQKLNGKTTNENKLKNNNPFNLQHQRQTRRRRDNIPTSYHYTSNHSTLQKFIIFSTDFHFYHFPWKVTPIEFL